jgi:hypothetical protein
MPPITGWHIDLYERDGSVFRFKAVVFLSDNSRLHIKEYCFQDRSRKYSYHWKDTDGNLIIRWDNAEHWRDLPTYPHHKHTSSPQKVSPSDETNLESVINFIVEQFLDPPPAGHRQSGPHRE